MRSLLMVSADNAQALAVSSTQADAVIVDLTINVSPSIAAHSLARNNARQAIDLIAGRMKVFVRVNMLASGMVDDDLAAVMPACPDGIVLPGAMGTADVEHLAAKLRVLEARLGREDGETQIIPLISNSSGVLAAGGMRPVRRMVAIGWEPFHPLSRRDVPSLMDSAGRYHDVPRLTRTLTLLAASHAGVLAIDAPTPLDTNDAFYSDATRAERDGFGAKIVCSEAHARAVNDIFRLDRPAAL
ncbi:aldolase/citrate lyase family protein [Pseudochelatococcus sp. G4_1912]|uniref:aldolase/citrate lyase family protein n=1 Tax=Pseudochelatococcus sp. G4_1912 TaxID=3114288 RepID=UPI0039C6893B